MTRLFRKFPCNECQNIFRVFSIVNTNVDLRRYVRSAPLSQPPVITLWSKNNDDVSRPVKKKYKRTNRRVYRNSITITRKHRWDRGTETTTRHLVSRALCVCVTVMMISLVPQFGALGGGAIWSANAKRDLSIKNDRCVSCKNIERTLKAGF